MERNIEGTLWDGKSMLDVIEKYTEKTGRFPLLPDFAYGTWLGMQGGKDKALKEIKLENPQFSDSPHQQAISKSTSKPKKAKEVDDGIPF